MENKTLDLSQARESLLDAILSHVPFDGWSDTAFRAAAQDAGLTSDMARVIAPRGGLDLAADYHRRGDAQLIARLDATELSAMRFRDRIATAVRFRIEVAGREAVRRGSTLFALPQNAAIGAQLIWGTADAIWTALGDTSQDVNWYSKRATLAAVYASTVLYWLGDTSEDQADTWAFLDRRIEGVMRFEKVKARLKEMPLLGRLMASPVNPLNHLRAPGLRPDDLPGRSTG
jgi:ubiquinone biosynthesis protein COQ9